MNNRPNAYNEGWNAYQRGHGKVSCPRQYSIGSAEFSDWVQGWHDAKDAAMFGANDSMALMRGIDIG